MKDVSLEYAHIYANSEIGLEHHVAVEVLADVTQGLDQNGESFNLIVLVDDYSFPDPSFDYPAFSEWLKDKGYKPDFMYRESQLIPVCDEVLKLVKDERFKAQVLSYIKNKKYPCSLFIAAWYLVRLGALSHPAFASEIQAKRIINILPESFRPFEEEGLRLIRATDHVALADKIEYRYLEGRLLA
jgi:hypothetical protein